MSEWWKDYPWRMIQTNLREIDMADMDADRFVAELKAFDTTVVMTSVAGIVANYDTKLKYHYKNPYLGGDDLRTIIDKCHEVGIKVIARTDFSKVRREIFEQHPDWAYRTADGGLMEYNGNIQVCLNGGFQQEYQFKIIEEVLKTFPFDGIFYNMAGFQPWDYSWKYYGMCHCDACREKFKKRFGLDLPTSEDMKDPVYRKYRIFTEECSKKHERDLADFVKSINPNVAVDMFDFIRCESSTEISNRPLPLWQYNSSSNTRALHGPGQKRQATNSSVDFIAYPYRHISVTPALQKLRLWQNLANRGGLDYYCMGRLDNHLDKSGYAGIQEVFHFHKEHERDLMGLRSKADIVVMRTEMWKDSPEIRGWIRALTEAHIPFDELFLSDFDHAEVLLPYRTAVLGNVRYLSDDQCEWLDWFAEHGGTVLATGQTSFYDGQYEFREQCGLRCLGIEKVVFHEASWDQISIMYGVDSEEDHKVLPHFHNIPYIAPGQEIEYVETSADTERYLRMIPRHRFGPPELCYFNQTTDIPGITVKHYGKGKGVYIPFQIGGFFYQHGHANSEWFMQDVLRTLCGAVSLSETLTPMVEATLSGDDCRTVVQLVNNSGHFGNSYFEPLPITGIQVRIPFEGRAKSVRALNSEQILDFVQEDGFVYAVLPQLGEYEAIIVE